MTTDPKNLEECRECGAFIDRHSPAKHRKWHESLKGRLSEIEAYALDAQEQLGN